MTKVMKKVLGLLLFLVLNTGSLSHFAFANQTQIPVSAIEINPQYSDVLDGGNPHREKSRFYNALGKNQWMADERFYSQLFTEQPSQPQATDAYNIALKHFQYGHIQHAKYWMQKAIVGQPQNVMYLKLWLKVLVAETDPITVEMQLNDQLMTEPARTHQASFLKALLFDEEGQWGLACKAYQLYIQLYPESLLVRYARQRQQTITMSYLEKEPQDKLWD